MIIVPKKRIWTAQPQQFVPINQHDQITTGLKWVYHPAFKDRNYIGATGFTAGTTSPVFGGGPYGYKISGGTTGTIGFALPSTLTTTYTVVAAFLDKGAGVLRSILGTAGATYASFQFRLETTNVFTGMVYNSTGTSYTASTTNTVSSGLNVGVITATGTTFASYLNGNVSGKGSGTSTGTLESLVATSQKLILCGNTNAGVQPFTGDLYLVLIYNRVLSQAEIVSISQNPWQVFAPGPSYAVAVPGAALAGSASTSLTYTDVGGLTTGISLSGAVSASGAATASLSGGWAATPAIYRVARPRVWQPSQAPTVDWGNPITRGMFSVVLPDYCLNTDFCGGFYTVGTGTFGTANYAGKRALFGSMRLVSNKATFQIGSGYPYTMLTFAANLSWPQNTYIFGSGNGTHLTTGSLWAVNDSGSEALLNYPISSYPFDVCLASASNGTVLSSCINGNYNPTTEPVNTYSTALTAMSYFDGTLPFAGYLYLAVAWTRTLSPAELESITSNPWQLFLSPVKSYPLSFQTYTSGAVLAGAASAVDTNAGALTTAIQLAGSVTAADTNAGDLTTGVGGGGAVLAGAVAAAASDTGALTTAIQLAATVSTADTNAGALTTGIPLAGTVSATDTNVGALTTAIQLAGTVSATDTNVGALTTGIPLLAAVTATDTNVGALTTSILLAGAASATDTNSATLTAGSGLSAAVTATDTNAGALTTAIQLAGAVNTSDTNAGALTTAIQLAATVSTADANAGALTTGIPLAGTVTATDTNAGALTTAIQLAGAVNTTDTNAGAITTAIKLAAAVSGIATPTGSLNSGALFSSSVSSTATVAGAMTTGIPLLGAVTATDTNVGALTTQIRLTGAVSTIVTDYGSITTNITMSASVLTALLTTPAVLITADQMSGSVSTIASMVAALTTGIKLAGGVSAAGSTVAALTTQITLTATTATVTSVTGALTIGVRFAGSVSTTGVGAAGLLTGIPLQGSVATITSGTGVLGNLSAFTSACATYCHATGSLFTSIQLSAADLAILTAGGSLTTHITLNASVLVAAMGAGNMVTGTLPVGRETTLIRTYPSVTVTHNPVATDLILTPVSTALTVGPVATTITISH